MIELAKEAILTSSPESSVYIGADSIRQKKGNGWQARYTVVVVLHKDSKHGCKIFHRTEVQPDFGNLKQRLMQEVSLATQTAMDIIDVIGDRRLEIHLDLNPKPEYKSNIAVKEALGWCMGLGLDAKVKPEAWAASNAADFMVRH